MSVYGTHTRAFQAVATKNGHGNSAIIARPGSEAEGSVKVAGVKRRIDVRESGYDQYPQNA
ncbi:MAG: hypothetical protein PHS75_02400 [Anaerolineaceae bacterium]|nr:hypothetical protein [Anaerolineaceae bacterium]